MRFKTSTEFVEYQQQKSPSSINMLITMSFTIPYIRQAQSSIHIRLNDKEVFFEDALLVFSN